jgi:tetratricopeptide (TPR) repeat protein
MGECVICLQSDPAPVQSGCACRGDAGLAHAACLVEKAVAQRASRGPAAWTTCQTCTQEFSGAIGLALAEARCETEVLIAPGAAAWASRASRAAPAARAGLGVALRRHGRYADAERVQRGVVEELRASLGDEHPETILGLNNLGAVLADQGKHAEAETILREALRAHDHPATRSNLATALYRRGEYAEAERLHRSVVRERELALGSEHVETLQSKCNFGVALAAQNKLGEAEALFREVATARRRVLGDEHAETLVCVGNLASLCLFPQGRCAEAETIQRHVLSVQRRTIGEDHPHTLTTAHNLADSIWAQGRHEEARELAGVVLEARVRTQGWSHPETENAARSSVRMQFSAARTSPQCAANACAKSVVRGAGACVRCGAILYCSRACRVADARAHKRTCTLKTRPETSSVSP